MADNTSSQNQITKLITSLIGMPWLQIIINLWEASKDIRLRIGGRGMYEVLEYESILELHDNGCKRATFNKREKVRYLQDNIIAYQDQAWGDGKILVGYRCSKGVPVDQYRSGYKTQILISLRDVKKKGDIDEFNIQWRIHQGFLRNIEQWETEVCHSTRKLIVKVIFPKVRPPLEVSIIERSSHLEQSMGENARKRLPDGRWLVQWEIEQPRLHEQYIFQWEW